MKLVRSYIGDQRPALAKTKFLAESIVHTQDTITVVTDPKDEDWDAGKYTLETIIGILSGAVAAVTGTPPSDLSARAGAANDQHAKAAGSEADGEAIDFTCSLHLHHRLAGAICTALVLEKNVPQCAAQLRLDVLDCSAPQNLSWIFEQKRVPMQALLFVHLVLHLENELTANTHKWPSSTPRCCWPLVTVRRRRRHGCSRRLARSKRTRTSTTTRTRRTRTLRSWSPT